MYLDQFWPLLACMRNVGKFFDDWRPRNGWNRSTTGSALEIGANRACDASTAETFSILELEIVQQGAIRWFVGVGNRKNPEAAMGNPYCLCRIRHPLPLQKHFFLPTSKNLVMVLLPISRFDEDRNSFRHGYMCAKNSRFSEISICENSNGQLCLWARNLLQWRGFCGFWAPVTYFIVDWDRIRISVRYLRSYLQTLSLLTREGGGDGKTIRETVGKSVLFRTSNFKRL